MGPIQPIYVSSQATETSSTFSLSLLSLSHSSTLLKVSSQKRVLQDNERPVRIEASGHHSPKGLSQGNPLLCAEGREIESYFEGEMSLKPRKYVIM